MIQETAQSLSEQLGRPLTVREVAQLLGFSEQHIRDNYRKLRGLKLGKAYVFHENTLREAIEDAQRIGEERKEARPRARQMAGASPVPMVAGRERTEQARGRGLGNTGVGRDAERTDRHGLLDPA